MTSASPFLAWAPWRPVAPLIVLLAAVSSVTAQPGPAWPDRAAHLSVGAPSESPFEAALGDMTTVEPVETTAEAITTLLSTTTTTADPHTPQNRALQARLAELGYDIGPVDGVTGGRTSHSIMAFQKVEGLKRTGADSPALRAALAAASRPAPMVPNGPATRIEVDLNRQVLFHWKGGKLVRILPISSGNGKAYCVEGACDVAVTPPGNFTIGRKASGLEIAPLGQLWWPMYFNGGIAIHGSPSVPAYPASHGCLRIPMYSAPSFFTQVDRGTPVILVGRGPGPVGARAVPPPEPPPDPHPNVEPPPDEPPVTTSTVPAAPTTTTIPSGATSTSTSTSTSIPPDGWE